MSDVFLCCPTYDNRIDAGAARGLWGWPTNGEHGVMVVPNQSSLLECNCNSLWADALNHREGREKEGFNPTWFVMLHSDIEPEPFWLDKLLKIAEENNADLLSAIVPLKDERGLTSTAIQGKDIYKPFARLSMKQVWDDNMPEVFDAKQLKAALDNLSDSKLNLDYKDDNPILLCNTGCFAARLDRPWSHKVWFDSFNSIIPAEKNGKVFFQAVVQSEDWWFSRRVAEEGGRVFATRSIKLTHKGGSMFPNNFAWGVRNIDDECISKETDRNDWFPYDIDGWLTVKEGLYLAKIAKDKDVLEIGSYCGRSTICLAKHAKTVMAIDPHDGRGTPRPKNTLEQFRANLVKYGVNNKVETSLIPLVYDQNLPDKKYQVIFVDGAHDEKSVNNDILCAQTLLEDDGFIIFHDYLSHSDKDEAVKLAVDKFISSGKAKFVEVIESMAVVKLI